MRGLVIILSRFRTIDELKKIRDELIENLHNGKIPYKLGNSRLTDLRNRIRDLEDFNNPNLVLNN